VFCSRWFQYRYRRARSHCCARPQGRCTAGCRARSPIA
jgi:hypothetical protein